MTLTIFINNKDDWLISNCFNFIVCKAGLKYKVPALIITTPSLVIIKLRLLLCPVLSYVGGPVAPIADHTFGIFNWFRI